MFSDQRLNQLFRYGYSLTNNDADAYDLLHGVIEKYLARVDSVPGDRADAYIRQIMRNRFIDEFRREQRFPEDDIEQGDHLPVDVHPAGPEELLVSRELLEQVWNSSDPFERELLYLWAYEALIAREISDQLEVPRGTILSRIHRLRKKLASLADDDLPGAGEQQ